MDHHLNLKALAVFMIGAALLVALLLGCGRVVDDMISGGTTNVSGVIKDPAGNMIVKIAETQ